MKKIYLFCLYQFAILSYSCAQTQYADEIIDAYYNPDANPNFSDFYGIPGIPDNCNAILISPEVCLGNSFSFVSITEGSYITVGFTDNAIIDAPNQNDLFIDEIGASSEFADVYVSSDYGATFTFFGTVNGGTNNALDLNDINYTRAVNAVKIEGKDNLGCVAGFDVVRVYGIAGANCTADARTNPASDLCADSGVVDLNELVIGNPDGRWEGDGILEGMVNTTGVSAEFTAYYIVEDELAACPSDTSALRFLVDECDCAGIPNGNSIIDECGECWQPDSPNFNRSCSDCKGILHGTALLDECGECLEPNDPNLNQSCADCAGTPNGTAVLDYCDECLEPDDPRFNRLCAFKNVVYIPNVFSPNADGRNDFFQVFADTGIVRQVKQYAIYDRWGNQIYTATNFDINSSSDWWDGRFKGETLEQGVYVFAMEIEFRNRDIKTYQGDVMIMR